MATFEADHARLIALELKERITTLYAAALPIFTTAASWTLNGLDPALPLPFDIRCQLEAYRALELERLRLDAYVTEFLTADIDDTLTYPPPPDSPTGLADGSLLADGSSLADG